MDGRMEREMELLSVKNKECHKAVNRNIGRRYWAEYNKNQQQAGYLKKTQSKTKKSTEGQVIALEMPELLGL